MHKSVFYLFFVTGFAMRADCKKKDVLPKIYDHRVCRRYKESRSLRKIANTTPKMEFLQLF